MTPTKQQQLQGNVHIVNSNTNNMSQQDYFNQIQRPMTPKSQLNNQLQQLQQQTTQLQAQNQSNNVKRATPQQQVPAKVRKIKSFKKLIGHNYR